MREPFKPLKHTEAVYGIRCLEVGQYLLQLSGRKERWKEWIFLHFQNSNLSTHVGPIPVRHKKNGPKFIWCSQKYTQHRDLPRIQHNYKIQSLNLQSKQTQGTFDIWAKHCQNYTPGRFYNLARRICFACHTVHISGSPLQLHTCKMIRNYWAQSVPILQVVCGQLFSPMPDLLLKV